MEDEHVSAGEKAQHRVRWNNGKLTGAKPQLKPSHVWSIRTTAIRHAQAPSVTST